MGTFWLLFWSALMVAAGLGLTALGFWSGDPASTFGLFRWLGPIVLGAGVLLALGGLLLRGSDSGR